MNIAIIGGGAAGMITAYLLDQKGHEVEVFEKTDKLGGNIRTLNKNVSADSKYEKLYLEGGVIEFSNAFVQFKSLLDKLHVPHENVEIGTGVFLKNGNYYLSTILAESNFKGIGLIKEKVKLLRLYLNTLLVGFKLWRLNPELCRKMSLNDIISDKTTATKWLRLFMMYSYSTDFKKLSDFSAELALHNIQNYMLSGWFRICGGVYTYIEKILDVYKGKVHLNLAPKKVIRTEEKVVLEFENGEQNEFDKVVFAVPPHQILSLINDPSDDEVECFSNWKSNNIETIIHKDNSLYSNYPIVQPSEFDFFETVENWGYNAILNQVCGIKSKEHFYLAYNMESQIAPKNIIHKAKHETPLYTQKAIESRKKIKTINGSNNTFFAGAWLADGLHEGATISAQRISELIK
jgi:predicted NAD/FAD-binding protein